MLHLVTLCGRGLHEMTEDNTLITHDGSKRCRACRRIAAKKRRKQELLESEATVFRTEENDDNVVDFELPRGSLGKKWQEDAKCREMNNSKWFFVPLLEDEMVEYCKDCPVITLCWAYAVASKEEGVWGGTTQAQRQRLTLEQRITVRKQYPGLYNEYLGIPLPSEPEPYVASKPSFGEGREATVQRALEASDYSDSMAGVTTKDRMLGNLSSPAVRRHIVNGEKGA